jgi:geranylgeranyl reductase family protein
MSDSYDAIIVGGGPAGATAAARLAAEGGRVALLDRGEFPRDKPCGGGLSPKAYRLLDLDVSDLVCARPRRVILRTSRVGPVALEARQEAIWMVQRAAFDARLVEHATQRGATLLTRTMVQSVRPATTPGGLATVETSRGSFQARVVVGADGADSVVARSSGLRPARDRQYILALEAEGQRKPDASPLEAVVDFRLPRGYAWVFPKGDVCNVGVGTDDRRQFRALRQHLAQFLSERQLEFVRPPRVIGHKIPAWRGAEPLHWGNLLLAGDAAGVADPFFGEGIAYAIQTGRFAADAAARYCAGDWDDLSGYTTAVQSVLARDLRFWSALSQVIYRAPSLSLWLLSRHRRLQRLADAAICGDRSFSRTWKR